MTDSITLTGLVATAPRHIVTSEGLPITSFRLASTQRRFDRSKERWIDGDTNWYTVTAFRQLATNSATSVEKGQRVIVTGRLRIREWDTGERAGTTIDVEADAIGHDLSWGTSVFARSIASTALSRSGESAEGSADPGTSTGTGTGAPDGDALASVDPDADAWSTDAAPTAVPEAEVAPPAPRSSEPVPALPF